MPKNKSSVFAASVVAASATALSVSSSSPGFNSNVKEAGPNKDHQGSASMEKFAPRFDGLRYDERSLQTTLEQATQSLVEFRTGPVDQMIEWCLAV
ncbi:hypothetical protein SADUNF_Sadunf13G0103600 [Salix dunnii]|uniref:Uncharacterized protein n=1 Tax=Salix dunnii TaxID=1413687 RepID=A0A835JLI5_9ROSI|nr:hypothetical protein SADUNF_Sadunf13G0103600 [Salix dunnii]